MVTCPSVKQLGGYGSLYTACSVESHMWYAPRLNQRLGVQASPGEQQPHPQDGQRAVGGGIAYIYHVYRLEQREASEAINCVT